MNSSPDLLDLDVTDLVETELADTGNAHGRQEFACIVPMSGQESG